MKLLIMGASDSEGTLLANFADSWREQLRLRLPALIGEDVEVEHRRFYVHVAGGEAFFKNAIEDSRPDFVIMGCTGYAFTTSSVGNRLRRLFGQRFGDWAERRSAGFDRLTETEMGSSRERVNFGAHWLAGKLIGRDSISTYEEVLGGYRRCIEYLARSEDLDAIIMGTTYNGPRVQRRLPYLRRLADRFNAELKSTAEAHRFAFLDRQAIINTLPPEVSRPDQLHTGPEIHALYAEALLAVIPARRAGESAN